MDQIDIENLRRQAIRNASEEVLMLYGNPDIGNAIMETSSELCFNSERELLLVHILGDIILGIANEGDLMNKMQEVLGVSEQKSRELVNKFRPFLGNQTPSVPVAHNELKEKLELRPESVPSCPAPISPQEGEGSTRPLTREEVLASLAPRRTMASDIETIKHNEQVGYGTENT
jgi:hypothetical protein